MIKGMEAGYESFVRNLLGRLNQNIIFLSRKPLFNRTSLVQISVTFLAITIDQHQHLIIIMRFTYHDAQVI